jgi:hypothetical protein
MNVRIKLVRGDTPQVTFALQDVQEGLPLNLVGATVRMYFRREGTVLPPLTLTGNLLSGREKDDGTIDTTSPYNVVGRGGRVAFRFGAGDLLGDPGYYEGEIEITFADGTVQTVYEVARFVMRQQF